MAELPQSSIGLERPNAARVYDYLLGGGANFASDRKLARQLLEIIPGLRTSAQLNRAFLRRAVEFCLREGISQFLDIGSGIPTVGNVHEVAQQGDPTCRVVYVDYEPVAVTHTQDLLKDNPNATMVNFDLRRPEELIADNTVRRLLDFSKPIGLLMISVLHFVPSSAELAEALRTYVDALAPGSYLCISHATQSTDRAALDPAVDLYSQSATQLLPRPEAEVRALFAGTELVDPGLVHLPQWRPDGPDDAGEHPEESLYLAGVGRKT